MIFEPVLFGITGTVVKIKELDPHVVAVGLGIISVGVIIRILSTIAIAFGDNLNLKEKVFKLTKQQVLIIKAAVFCLSACKKKFREVFIQTFRKTSSTEL